MIDYSEYDCMCWEKDEHGQTLCCDPPECSIEFCPIKQLLSKLEDIKPLLKQIERDTGSRPPKVTLQRILLNELWSCVWMVLDGSELTTNSEEEK